MFQGFSQIQPHKRHWREIKYIHDIFFTSLHMVEKKSSRKPKLIILKEQVADLLNWQSRNDLIRDFMSTLLGGVC